MSLLGLGITVLAGCAATPRPTPPSAGAPIEDPWGVVPYHLTEGSVPEIFTVGIIASMKAKRDQLVQSGSREKIPYRALTLSGGGSRGAYGAGVLAYSFF